MLRTNLSTRPFYNVRAVQTLLAFFGLVVLAITALNIVQLVRLTASERTLGTHAQDAETEAARLRADTVRIRGQIDPRELEGVAAAAHEANAIIERRTFSWSELLARLERTLPPNARVTTVQPGVQRDGRFHVVLGVQARTVEDLNALFEALEEDGAFRQVFARQQQRTDEGLMEAVVEGYYRPQSTADTAGAGAGQAPDDRAAAEARAR